MEKEKINKVKDQVIGTLIPSSSYVFTQAVMLFLNYGLKYKMPWWVIWFPTLVYIIFLLVLLFIFIIFAILSAFAD